MECELPLPPGLRGDIDKLGLAAERFKSGLLSAEEFRRARVPMGVYEQRTDGTYMLRVRLPGGALAAKHMRAIAAAAERFGSGAAHATTRQDMQIHCVIAENIAPALRALLEGCLSTKGGCGDTVRNITACCLSGVCPKECFDLGPHCRNLTQALLGDGQSYELPRKFKIAFSGCSEDCAGACVNDVGLIAKTRDGVEGFAVCAGGGMGARSRIAEMLEEFVPADGIYRVVRAVRAVFHARGNRENRKEARLRFLVDKIGFGKFASLYKSELAAAENAAPCPGTERRREIGCSDSVVPAGCKTPSDFRTWRACATEPQKQPGYRMAHISLPLGDIGAEALRGLAGAIEAFPGVEARVTPQQNLVLLWIPERETAGLYAALDGIGLAGSVLPLLRNMVSCAGASTCRMGVCASRGLARAMYDHLKGDAPGLSGNCDLQIGISGCPNACGRHLIADIGFSGGVRTIDGRKVPHYRLLLGGRQGEGRTAFALPSGMVPARNVPALTAELLSAFSASASYPDFDSFLANGGMDIASALCERYQGLPSYEAEPMMYEDFDAPGIGAPNKQ